MTFTICDREVCTGCSLCADVCPFGAISIERDEYGFAGPRVDQTACVECFRCREACPANSEHEGRAEKVFAAYAKDKDIRKKSSSGGIFRLLADATVKAGGAVAAVGYDDSFHAVYKIAEDGGALDEMMGSKYTEASADGIYGKVASLLDEGRRVLFVGTPCRAAAMKSIAGDRENLLTVDFICHGVPSPILLEKYLAENFDGVKSVSFRDKTHGWQEFSMKVSDENKTYVGSLYKDPYLRTFLGNRALRDSCFDCRFKDGHYVSDITIGDFWGISSFIPSMNDDGGTSCVVIRTEKGSSAFDEIKERLVTRESDVRSLAKANGALIRSSRKPAGRDVMLGMLRDGKSFSAIAEEFGKPLPFKIILKERAKRTAKKILGKIKK